MHSRSPLSSRTPFLLPAVVSSNPVCPYPHSPDRFRRPQPLTFCPFVELAVCIAVGFFCVVSGIFDASHLFARLPCIRVRTPLCFFTPSQIFQLFESLPVPICPRYWDNLARLGFFEADSRRGSFLLSHVAIEFFLSTRLRLDPSKFPFDTFPEVLLRFPPPAWAKDRGRCGQGLSWFFFYIPSTVSLKRFAVSPQPNKTGF